MARRRVAEEARRKKRTMYLTDAEYDSAIGHVASLRGDGVDYRKPTITQTSQRPNVEAPPFGAYRAEALRTDLPVDPKPVRKEGEAIQIYELRLNMWKKRNGQ